MASTGQSAEQKPQPMQFLKSITLGRAWPSLGSGAPMEIQPVGQTSGQTPQPLHFFLSKNGFFHSPRFTRSGTRPEASLTAPSGQTFPQASHSIQVVSSIRCSSFFSPEAAPVGQTVAQAVHPLHA